jgi:predicted MFS family arabinose efflux permease
MKSPEAAQPPLESVSPEFRPYLTSTGLAGIAIAMQQLLLAWILIGILELPASEVGLVQAVVGIPGIVLILLGGAKADGMDPRALLIKVYACAPVLPLFLVVMLIFSQIALWNILLWGLGMSFVISYTSPAQQALLNRVARGEVQKSVSAASAIGFIVQIMGLAVAGTLEILGLVPVLLIQLVCFALAALMVARISPSKPKVAARESTLLQLKKGLAAIAASPVIAQALSINFISSIFNAGSFMTVFPFIVRRIYEGDAFLLSMMMVIFYCGATASSLAMMRFMPLERPGRIFLLMQLSRMFILGIMWLQPALWVFAIAAVLWGINMGVTLTLARTIVQESATEEFRGRIMSVFTLGLLGSAPIGAIVLGFMIEAFGTLNALLPAMLLSLCLFLYGVIFSRVYHYKSPTGAAAS